MVKLGRHIRITVVPSAGEDKIIPREPLLVRVKSPPLKGAANRSAARLLSEYFGERVKIVSGGRKPGKIAEIG